MPAASGAPGGGAASPWRSVVTVSLAMGVLFAGHSMLMLTVPLVGLRYGLSPALVGAVVAVPAMMPLLLAIPLGNVVGRWDPRRVLGWGFGAYALGVAISLLSPTVLGLIVTQVIVGLMHMVLVIAAQSAVAGLGEGSRMERAFGLYTSCLSVGQLLGPLAGGILLDRNEPWVPFAVMAALPLLAVAIVARLPSSPPGPRLPGQGFGYGSQLSLLRRNVGVQMSLWVTTGVLFALGAHAAILPLFLKENDVPAATIGLLVSVRAFFSTIIRPVTPWVVRTLGGRGRTLLVAVVVVAAATGLVGLTTAIVPVAILAALVGLGAGISQPLSMVAVADNVPLEMRSPALGMRLMGNRGAQVASPLLLGFVVEAAGFAVAFLAAGGVLAMSAVAVARLVPRFDRFERPRSASPASSPAD